MYHTAFFRSSLVGMIFASGVWVSMSYADPTPQSDSSAPTPTRFEQVLMYVYEQNPRLVSERISLKIADEKVSQANAGLYTACCEKHGSHKILL